MEIYCLLNLFLPLICPEQRVPGEMTNTQTQSLKGPVFMVSFLFASCFVFNSYKGTYHVTSYFIPEKSVHGVFII